MYQLAHFVTSFIDTCTGIQLCRWAVVKPEDDPDVLERLAIAGCRVDVMQSDLGHFLRVSISSGDVEVVFLALPDRPGYLVRTATFPVECNELHGLEVGKMLNHRYFCKYLEAAVKIVRE